MGKPLQWPDERAGHFPEESEGSVSLGRRECGGKDQELREKEEAVVGEGEKNPVYQARGSGFALGTGES